jgi:thymidylate kinase
MPDISTTQRPVLISFSGIDGAGKSTQIAKLCAHLSYAGQRVQMRAFWDDAASLKSIREGAGHKVFGGDKGVGTPDAPIRRRDKDVRSPLMTLVRLGIYFIDALSLRRVVKKALRSDADYVIFDRYIYDEIANLNLDNWFVRLYIGAILKLVPRPHAALVLDADPVQACARKPEYPLEFVLNSRRSYLRLAQMLSFMTVIPPGSVESAGQTVAAVASSLRPSEAQGARYSGSAPVRGGSIA